MEFLLAEWLTKPVIGLERGVGKLEMSVGYLRQQTIRNNARDTVAHAPLIAVGFPF